jgi:hypothetical protein
MPSFERSASPRLPEVMLVAAALLLPTSLVHANDSAFGGAGTNLIPLKETRIRMVSEDIVATYSKTRDAFYDQGDWAITAHYVFQNPSTTRVALQMGFPEARCSDDVDCTITKPFRDMTTTVRGKKVKHRKGSVSLASEYEVLGRVWLFDVAFAPGESVEVVHTYSVHGVHDMSGVRELMYITRTGALWAAPIGSARFRFRMPSVVAKLSHTTDPAPQSISFVQVGTAGFTEVEYQLRDWTPTGDLYVAFWRYPERTPGPKRTGALPPGPRCPLDMEDAMLRASEHDNDKEYIAWLTRRWASSGSLERLRTCALYVQAKYGKRFDPDRWNRYFYGPDGWKAVAAPASFFQPNPGFSEALYTSEDLAFLELLQQAIKRAEAGEGASPRRLVPVAAAGTWKRPTEPTRGDTPGQIAYVREHKAACKALYAEPQTLAEAIVKDPASVPIDQMPSDDGPVAGQEIVSVPNWRMQRQDSSWCVNRAFEAWPTLRGRVSLRMAIGERGYPEAVTIEHDDTGVEPTPPPRPSGRTGL